MPVQDRAAQFAPFAALTGHHEAVKETARLTDERIELDEYCKAVIDEKLQKIENMRSSLQKKFHQIFLFPGRNEKDYEDPDKDPTMKKINKHAMTKFSDALASWKTRVKARIIDKKEPYSEIVKDNPTITEEQFQIFKEACEAEDAKKSLST